MKRLVGRLANRFGYQISRVRDDAPREALSSAYECALVGLLSCRSHLRIAQVGANDGLLNDPQHAFARKFADRTHMLLMSRRPR